MIRRWLFGRRSVDSLPIDRSFGTVWIEYDEDSRAMQEACAQATQAFAQIGLPPRWRRRKIGGIPGVRVVVHDRLVAADAQATSSPLSARRDREGL